MQFYGLTLLIQEIQTAFDEHSIADLLLKVKHLEKSCYLKTGNIMGLVLWNTSQVKSII